MSMTACDECGFDFASVPETAIGQALRDAGDGFVTAVGGAEGERPAPEVWSPLEYACHVRDVAQIQIGRVARGLVEDTPSFEPMGRDERPARFEYARQDAQVVARQLVEAVDALAAVFDA